MVKLSKRQKEMLLLSCKTDNEIASRLYVSRNWVIRCKAILRKKLGTKSTIETAIKACKMGLVDIYDFIL